MQSIREALKDPFLRARLRTLLYYSVFMIIVLSASAEVLDRVLRDILAQAFTESGVLNPDALADRIQRIRLILRLVNIAIFTIGGYFLIGLTFRPVQQLMAAQRRFIANVSHELRTPLTTMRTELEIALRAPDAPTQHDAMELLARTAERAEHLSRVIQFFQVMADYGAPRSIEMQRRIGLEACLRSVLEQLAEHAKAKQVGFELDLPADDSVIEGHAIAIEKLFVNLLRNAITYAPRGSTIRIRACEGPGTVVFAVRDEGPGIYPDDLARIFEPFARGRNAVPGGAGVGLSIVREVTRLHGARVSVESELGKGAEFKVIFRKSKAIPKSYGK